MEISELNREEKIALVGLVEFVAESNASVSDEERAEISQVVAALGAEEYRALVDDVDAQFADEAALKSHLEGIQRPQARDLIFGTALETALSDADNLRHAQMLDWLRAQWNISVELDPAR